jgi:hypothetical protein
MNKTIDIIFAGLAGNHQTMIHMGYPACIKFLDKLYKKGVLDNVNVTIRAPHTACQSVDNGVVKTPGQLCITFDSYTYTLNYDNTNYLRMLWNYILLAGCEVVWKYQNRGYEIGENARIIRELDLQDFGE